MAERTVIFTVEPDPRPGLFEGRCALCGWQPFTAGYNDEITEMMTWHIWVAHLQRNQNEDTDD